MLSLCVYPSVCLSICPSHAGNTKTAKRRMAEILVFWSQRSQRNSTRVTPTGAPNSGEVGSNWQFSTNMSLYLRSGGRYRDTVTTDTYKELVYAVSNGAISSDLQWPSQITPFSIFCVAFDIFVVDREYRDFKFVHRLIVGSDRPRVTNHPRSRRGVVTSYETFKFWWAPTISLEWLVTFSDP